MDILGIRIKELRILRRLSQKELAEILDVRQNTVSRYETGIKLPSLEVLVLLAKALETSTDYLLGLTDI